MTLSDLRTARGLLRLINSSAGGVLCLAGQVDAAAVADFVGRYGREPARVAVIDAGSVTGLSPSGLEILIDHLDVARRSGRPATLHPSPVVLHALAAAGELSEPCRPGDAACAPSR